MLFDVFVGGLGEGGKYVTEVLTTCRIELRLRSRRSGVR